jgi:hypothetical protein
VQSGSGAIGERHPDIAHLTIDVHVTVRDRVDRRAWHYDCSLTELVEKLAAAAERHVEASLSGQALQQYRAGGEGLRTASVCERRSRLPLRLVCSTFNSCRGNAMEGHSA